MTVKKRWKFKAKIHDEQIYEIYKKHNLKWGGKKISRYLSSHQRKDWNFNLLKSAMKRDEVSDCTNCCHTGILEVEENISI